MEAARSGPAPAGWYQDPNAAPGHLRWWDGSQWTQQTRVADGPPAPVEAAWSPQAPSSATAGPGPGKPKKPWYRRTWVIVVGVILGLAIIGSAMSPPEDDPGGSDPAAQSDSAAAGAEGGAASDTAEEAGDPEKPNEAVEEGPAAKEEPAAEEEPELTSGQENALESAQSYVDMTGFSKAGLIQQLSSSAGEGFAKA